MNIAQLLEDQPALVGTLSAAIVGLILALGVNPTIGAAIGGILTIAAGIWIRAKVYSPKTVKALVAAAATQTATALAPTDTGQPGVITAGGQAVADAAATAVLAGVTAAPPATGGGVTITDIPPT